MLNGINYSNNTQYNYTNNYPNQNYFEQQNQNLLNAMYRNHSNLSTNSYSSNKYKLTYTEPTPRKKKSGKKKTVKFNEQVNIIQVQSYKEYNKIDDDINIDTFFNNDYYNNKPNININKKKGDKCECLCI